MMHLPCSGKCHVIIGGKPVAAIIIQEAWAMTVMSISRTAPPSATRTLEESAPRRKGPHAQIAGLPPRDRPRRGISHLYT